MKNSNYYDSYLSSFTGLTEFEYEDLHNSKYKIQSGENGINGHIN